MASLIMSIDGESLLSGAHPNKRVGTLCYCEVPHEKGSAKETGEQRNESESNQSNAAARHELLHALAFGSGVIVAVALQQIDCAPNAETGTESNNESLKNVNCAVEKIHNEILLKVEVLCTDHKS